MLNGIVIVIFIDGDMKFKIQKEKCESGFNRKYTLVIIKPKRNDNSKIQRSKTQTI